MKKSFFVLMAVLVVVGAVSAPWAMMPEPSVEAIDQMKDEIVRLNPQISNPDFVYPGETIWFIDQNGSLISQSVGNGDNIWNIAQGHLKKKIQATGEIKEMNILPASMQTPVEVVEDEKDNAVPQSRLAGKWIALIAALEIFFLALLIAWVISCRRSYLRNPNLYPPVIPGGLSKDPKEALRQIEDVYGHHHVPGYILRVVRGHLKRLSGPRYIEAKMKFGDGKDRIVRMKSGDEVTKEIYRNRSERIFKNHCGNLVYPIRDIEIITPEGWVFVEDSSYTPSSSVDSAAVDTSTAPVDSDSDELPPPPAEIVVPEEMLGPTAPSTPAEDREVIKNEPSVKLKTAPIPENEIRTVTVDIDDGSGKKIVITVVGEKDVLPKTVDHKSGRTIIRWSDDFRE